MRKHVGMLLCAILMIVVSVAEAEEYYTIEQVKEQAALGWHQTYEAYGRQIVIDVDAEIPDVSQVPIEQIVPAFRDVPSGGEENGLLFTAYTDDKSNIFFFDTPKEKEMQLPKGAYTQYENGIALPRDWDRIYPPGGVLTLQEAVDVVRDGLIRAGLDPADWDLQHPYQLNPFSIRDSETKELVLPGDYYMYFHQFLNGIPLLGAAGNKYRYMCMPIVDSMSVGVTDSDWYTIAISQYYPQRHVTEDAPLCSFEQVKKVFEKEIMDGHIRKAYGLEFGYLIYVDAEHKHDDRLSGVDLIDSGDDFYALPAWQLTCLYMYDRNKELPDYGSDNEACDELASLEYATLIVDAQTGELHEWMSDDKERMYFHGFLTWDEVK